MGKLIRDDDELLEFPDALGEDDEALGLDEEDALGSDIDEGPEDIGLDVDTLGSADDDLLLDLDDEESVGEADEGALDLGEGLDDDDDDVSWTHESEGSAEGFDEDLLPDEEEGELDDGGLEGLEDPDADGISDHDDETTVSISGDDDEHDEELERVEIDIG